MHENASIDTESLELSPYLVEDIGDVAEDTTTSSINEVLEHLHCYVQCLMSLLPLIERLLRQINHAQPRHHGTAKTRGTYQASFGDSALGSSIPAQSSYAAIVASYTSFASTLSEKESATTPNT